MNIKDLIGKKLIDYDFIDYCLSEDDSEVLFLQFEGGVILDIKSIPHADGDLPTWGELQIKVAS